ncbi:MAG TPA: LacI family DNA-binding transcriptional regulator [Armatimonadota bacterium]|nr:LacI family DNA-binding transcriptional regulator [Armatimonadota bacterium]
MAKHGRVSRQDVARAAGVSLTTVTHALNPVPGARVSAATRLRVQRLAREMGYTPSFVGRALVEGKSYTVGLLQPSYDSVFNGFYQTMMRGMARAMEPDDYHLLALFRSDDHRYLKVITQGRVDGMLILQSDFDVSHIARVLETGIPTVVVNRGVPVEGWPRAGCVHADHDGMMRQAVEELAALGCKSLLLVDDFRACDANARMADGFSTAVAARAARGLVGSTLAPDGSRFALQMRNAFAAGQRWDGIITDGVTYAEVVLEEAERAALRPARDFHLISTDIVEGRTTRQGLEESAYTHQPDLVGAEAWRLLRALIGREVVSERTVRVPYRRYPVRHISEGDAA